MLTVETEDSGDHTTIRLSGTIDEADDFAKLLGSPIRPLAVYCRNISRINSMGVKNWIQYFSSLARNGVSVRFHEMATVLVEQIDLVRNFTTGAEVVSILLPYRCEGCAAALTNSMKVIDIKSSINDIPTVKCPACGGKAVFDDVPEEYFAFLQR